VSFENRHSLPKRRAGKSTCSARCRTAADGSFRSEATSSSVQGLVHTSRQRTRQLDSPHRESWGFRRFYGVSGQFVDFMFASHVHPTLTSPNAVRIAISTGA
jgi:hypothetical protein